MPEADFSRCFFRGFLKSLALFAGVLSGLPAIAETRGAITDGVELEPFIVTGSYIPAMVDSAFSSPLTRLTSEDIARTGVGSNLLEVLRKSTPQFNGNANLGNDNAHLGSAGTGGGAKLSLRNTHTLVLINNRRAAVSPIAGTGGEQFVDLNLIPATAVERVEVFKDGASAVYGSDATAGVVNFVLKDEFEGLEINGRSALSSNRGDWSEQRVGFAAGTLEGKLRVFVAGEWSESDPLWLHERDFSNPSYGSPIFAGVVMRNNGETFVLDPQSSAPPAGVSLSPEAAVGQGIYRGPFNDGELAFGVGEPAQYAFNFADHETLLLGTERTSLLAALEYEITPDLSVFGDLLVTENETASHLAPQPLMEYITADHPYNPFDEDVWAATRFVDQPRIQNYETKSWRAVAGMKGRLASDLHFEAAALVNRIDQDFSNPGVIDGLLFAELAGSWPAAAPSDQPALNIFAREQDPLAVAAVTGTANSSFESVLESVDARVFGTAFSLLAGEVSFAAGVEHRREELSGTADAMSQPDEFGNIGWAGGISLQPFSASRDVTGVFAELRIPLVGEAPEVPGMHSVVLELAARHERYSDTRDPTVPRASLIWRPVADDLLFRATYSESFNAPGLYALSGPADVGYSDFLGMVPLGGSEWVEWGQAQVRSSENRELDPSEAESFTAGLVWSPSVVPGLTIELDYFRIDESGRFGTVPLETVIQDVENHGAESAYAGQVRLGAFDGPTVAGPGELFAVNPADVYITSGLMNLSSRKLRGVDLELSYGRNLGEWVYLSVASRSTWYDRYTVRIFSSSPAQETAGRATELNGTIPEWRVYNTVSLRVANLSFFVGHSYIPSMPYQWASPGARMEAYQTVDLAAGYAFGNGFADGLSVRLGVNNVGNEMPPRAPELFSQGADIGTYNPIGRLFFAEASYAF